MARKGKNIFLGTRSSGLPDLLSDNFPQRLGKKIGEMGLSECVCDLNLSGCVNLHESALSQKTQLLDKLCYFLVSLHACNKPFCFSTGHI